MKKTALTLFAAAFVLAACGDKKTTEGQTQSTADSTAQTQPDQTGVETDTANAANVETEAPVTVMVMGTVAEIQNGKDGYTAKIKEDSGREYFATISIPNLDDPKQYRTLKAGDKVTVKGESFKVGEELHIKVTELK